MDISARGQTVLAELKMLVLLANEQSSLRTNDMDFQDTDTTPHNINGVIVDEPQPQVLSPMPQKINFPRSRTRSTVKGRKSLASDRTDENSFLLSPPKTPLGIARTVRRTLSGGLSNILRPFQPSLTKNDGFPSLENHPQEKETRTLRKAVSTSFAKTSGFEHEGNGVRHHSRKNQINVSGPKSSSLRVRSTKGRARESVCSRNSTISIMEYLAARKRLEDTNEEYLVPLSEYGRNCHLYGCDSPHIWNPDKNSSCLVVHCDCDNEDRSKSHTHIDDTPLFYQPGGSTTTFVANPTLASCTSSIVENYAEFPLRPKRPSNPVPFLDSTASIIIPREPVTAPLFPGSYRFV